MSCGTYSHSVHISLAKILHSHDQGIEHDAHHYRGVEPRMMHQTIACVPQRISRNGDTFQWSQSLSHVLRLYPGLLLFRHQHSVAFGLGLHLSRVRRVREDGEGGEDGEDDEQIRIGVVIGLPTVVSFLRLQGCVRHLTPLCILYLRLTIAALYQTYCGRTSTALWMRRVSHRVWEW